MNVIITGASKGLGKAIAETFAASKNTLMLCARNEDELNKTALQLQQQYPNSTVHTKAIDISNNNNAKMFANWCLTFGTPDVLINNVGQFIASSLINEDDDVLEKLMQVNLYSAYHTTKTLLPAMTQKKKGHIFNICSLASLHAYIKGSSYSITKHALLGFSRNLREELKPYQIKVTSVIPGAIATESWANETIAQKKMIEAKDVATIIYSTSLLTHQTCIEEIVIQPE
ncbi:MAG: SDR family NAD(P)-dependent oxidoreductase [Chitinophagales bacterium]|nr:SDR family NAD(P)-dependent oxidoreductase [Chitinophagales bacterium]